MIRFLRDRSLLLVAGLAAGVAACNKPIAMGDPTGIVVAAPPETWNEIRDEVVSALEPRTFTVRDERVFELTYVDPASAAWERGQVMRQVLLIGTADDPRVAEAIDAYDKPLPDPPSTFQVPNLWARDQVVTVALIPAGGRAESIVPLLRPLGDTLLQQFDDYAAARMFVTGANDELRDSLRARAGFGLTVPRVYDVEHPAENVYIFRNDQPDPAELIRNVTVASRPSGEAPKTAEEIRQWRADLAARYTQPPQVTEAEIDSVTAEIEGRPRPGIQGIWSNPPGQWPAAGPFLTRVIDCEGRTYLVDAWLYAPGTRKYEYMFQLNTILDSFTCA